jgi:RNA polymerase sigma-70 factor (sigma-E family)
VARLLTGDRHQAEDLVQNALTKLASKWHRVDDPDAYVRRILYHEQVTWWRRRGRVREVPTVDVPGRSVIDGSAQVDRRLDLASVLRRLGPRQRAVLVLRYFEDLPESEVAELLGCSTGTVGSQAHRALARVREIAPWLADHDLTTNDVNTKELRR